jgi:hypothetical protein
MVLLEKIFGSVNFHRDEFSHDVQVPLLRGFAPQFSN